MGFSFWGNRNVTAVASSAYNMAGKVSDRINYKKTIIQSAVINGNPIGKALVDAYTSGYAARTQHFFRWAQNHEYAGMVGQVGDDLYGGDSLKIPVLMNYLGYPAGCLGEVDWAKTGLADISMWAAQYVHVFHPDLVNTAYEVDYNAGTNTAVIKYADGSLESFTPRDFDINGRYIYARWTYSDISAVVSSNPGQDVEVPDGGTLPSTTGWLLHSSTDTSREVTLTVTTKKTVTPLAGGTPVVTTTTSQSTRTITRTDALYYHYELLDSWQGVGGLYERRRDMRQLSDGKVVSSTTSTTETTATDTVVTEVTAETVAPTYTYAIGEQVTLLSNRRPHEIFIYKQGDGFPELDAMFLPSVRSGTYLPLIPFRINNQFVEDMNQPAFLKGCRKAYKKAFGAEYDDMVAELKKSSSLPDIDYAYTVFGVAIDVEDQSCRKYLYKFFKSLIRDPVSEMAEYESFKTKWNEATFSRNAWWNWYNRTITSDRPGAEPKILSYPTYVPKTLRIRTNGNYSIVYDIALTWSYIQETTGIGEGWVGAKAGQVDVRLGSSVDSFTSVTFRTKQNTGETVKDTSTDTVDEIHITWQISATAFTRLAIRGLTHQNYVYQGKSTFLTATDMFNDPEESGFIIPLHTGVFKELSAKDRNQMATASCFMLFNCYKTVRKKWYQTDVFAGILYVIAVVICVVCPPAGVTMMAGVFGGGIVGAIVASVIYVTITMVVAAILTRLFNRMLGPKYGAIAAAFVSILAMNAAGMAASGASITVVGLANSVTLIQATIAAASGYSGYMNGRAMELNKDSADLIAQTNKRLQEIQEMYLELTGGPQDAMMKNMIIDSIGANPQEDVELFLQRTLMCGSDIAEMTLRLIDNTVDITLSTDLP